MLTQQEVPNVPAKIVAYSSKTLPPAERLYSKIEVKGLAIVWACAHFHLYLYGARFVIMTDHKTLEMISNNPRSKLSARIERWGLHLQPYFFCCCPSTWLNQSSRLSFSTISTIWVKPPEAPRQLKSMFIFSIHMQYQVQSPSLQKISKTTPRQIARCNML